MTSGRVGMPPANIHRTVGALLAGGMVAVRASPGDRRLTLIELTHHGQRTFHEVLPAANAANALTLSVLSPYEQDAVIDSLRRLACGPQPSSDL